MSRVLECELCGEVLVDHMSNELLQKVKNAPMDSIICCVECKDYLNGLLPGYTKVYKEL